MAAVMATSSPSISKDVLRKSLESHDDQFTRLLSLIPSQYYIHPTDEEAEARYLNSKKRKSKEEKSVLRKQSIAVKFDPNSKTTADILLNKDIEIPDTLPSNVPVHKKAKLNGSQGFQNKEISKNGSSSPLPESIPPSKSLKPSTTSINDLKIKLADKLASFRNRRNITGTNDTPLGIPNGRKSKEEKDDDEEEGENEEEGEGEGEGETEGEGPTSRDALEAESRRRRGEVRDKRRRERKEQRKVDAKLGKKGKGKEVTKNVEEKNFSVAKTQLLVPQLSRETISYPSIALPSSSKPSKPFNPNTSTSASSHFDQSSFNLSEEDQLKSTHFKKLTNPTQALLQLQKHNKHLEGMDEEKREEAEQKERWAKALHRAEGGKVVDDEKTLKKAVKRVEKGKGKSGKEWAERKKQLAQSQAISIKKRNDNIASRNQAKKDKKLGIKKKDKKGDNKGKKDFKKGKGGRPGFEGKKGGMSKTGAAGGKDGKDGKDGKGGKGKGR